MSPGAAAFSFSSQSHTFFISCIYTLILYLSFTWCSCSVFKILVSTNNCLKYSFNFCDFIEDILYYIILLFQLFMGFIIVSNSQSSCFHRFMYLFLSNTVLIVRFYQFFSYHSLLFSYSILPSTLIQHKY